MKSIESDDYLYKQAMGKLRYWLELSLTAGNYITTAKYRGAAAEWATIAMALKPEKP